MTRALLFLAALVTALAMLAPPALAGTWLPAESLSATNTKNSQPAVAVSANGDAAAIWARNDASGSGAYTSLRQGGDGAWGNPHLLSNSSVLVGPAQIGMDGTGHATAVYNAFTVVPNEPVYSSSSVAGSWSPAVDVTGVGYGDSQAMAIDDAGDAVAAWRAPSANGPVVYAARRPHGSQWAAPQPISGAIPGGAQIDLATNSSGEILAVWLSGTRIAGAFYSPAAGWGSAFYVSNVKPIAALPQTALDDAGHATVVWESTSGYGYQVVDGARGSTASGLGKPEEVEYAGASTTPDLAVAADGSGILTWIRDNGGQLVVQAARRAAYDAPWGQPADLSSATSTCDSPSVAVGPNGNAMVVWNQKAPIDYLPYASAFDGSAWSSPHALTNPGNAKSNPSVAFDASGNATAVFAHGTAIQAARYDAAPSLSAVAVPAAGLVGQELSFSAAASDSLPPVALSWDFGDGASATGSPASHAYGAPGDYTVKVTARDDAGNEISETHVVHVTAPVSPPPPPAKDFPGLLLKSQRVVVRHGVGRVTAACSAGTAGACAGKLRLLSGKKVVASARFDVRAGRSARIRVRLRRVPRTLRASAIAHDAFGAMRTTSAKLKLLRRK